MSQRLTHVGESGAPRMVDVSDKAPTRRRARARALVRCGAEAVAAIREGRGEKGDPLGVARLAGIQGAKRTADLVPLCHPLSLTHVRVDAAIEEPDAVRIEAECSALDRTGVEMEALTGAAVAALAVIDMVKGLARGATIEEIALVEKEGGRSGTWRREDAS